MANKFSIAEARQHLASIVHAVEASGHVELTRRGEPVAVLISIHEFERLRGIGTGFFQRVEVFRQDENVDQKGIGGDIFENVRDLSAGREVDL